MDMAGPVISTDATSLIRPAAGPEAELVRRLRQRDPAAVGLAYDLHHRAVRAFARRLLADDAAAEDLVQDVFVALPGAAARFGAQASLRTYLIGIAVNHARHHLRAAARRRRALDRLGRNTPAPGLLPDEQAERRRLAAALARALDELPLKQRLVFLMCDVEHRPSPEVAALLRIPEGTVRTRLHHARERLRARLRAQGLP
jgi:RNA polymerase sigma-70 factor (ECF subfamily)